MQTTVTSNKEKCAPLGTGVFPRQNRGLGTAPCMRYELNNREHAGHPSSCEVSPQGDKMGKFFHQLCRLPQWDPLKSHTDNSYNFHTLNNLT